MSGRQSSAVELALKLAAAGLSNLQAARQAGVAVSSLRRAQRKRGEPPKPQPRGHRVATPCARL